MNTIKNLLITSIATLVCVSCVSIPYEKNLMYIDYASISKTYDLFLTEANSVNFEYEPIGSVEVTELSGVVTSDYIVEHADDIYGNSMKKGHKVHASPESAVSSAAKLAKEKGGNGIINLKIQYVFINNKSGYSISGMVIKRK